MQSTGFKLQIFGNTSRFLAKLPGLQSRDYQKFARKVMRHVNDFQAAPRSAVNIGRPVSNCSNTLGVGRLYSDTKDTVRWCVPAMPEDDDMAAV
jgi:hypothetical protein